ncbi:pupal cuticle protein 20-like isoform X1 [Bradysia coprophila]|uniref:pupal cuticle protein 20-like isoform X1 n=1 Tax=Bradysia coprophila TaxID=38358 RepID=UPI00187DA91D|nr:pupal cuticle protein 20-like isoform X1 [Bradysia coprophila]
MKVIIIATFIAACSCARLDTNYLPPASAPSAGGGPGLATPAFGRPGNNGFGGQQSGFGQQGGFGGGNQQSGYGGGSQQSGFGGGASQGSFSGGSSQSSFGSGSQQGGFVQQQPQQPQQPPIAILSYENVNNGDGSYKFSYETENGIKAQEQGELKNKGTDNAIQTVSGSYSYTAPDGQVITVTYIADENGFQPTGEHLPTPPPMPKEIAESLQLIAAAQAQGNQGYPSGNNNYNGPQNNGQYPSAPAQNDYQSAPVNNGYPSAPANNGYPSAPAPARPGNQYVPPSNQQRPAGNGNFNPQSGYKY